MPENPYEPPKGEPPIPKAVRRGLGCGCGITVAAPFGILAAYCFLTAWSYVGTEAAMDHPYVSGYLNAGVMCLSIGAIVGVLAQVAASVMASPDCPEDEPDR